MKFCQSSLVILLPCLAMHIAGFPEGSSQPAAMGRKTIQHRVALSSANVLPNAADGATEDSSVETKDLRMPGVHPQGEDTYLCSSFQLSEESKFITHFQPLASADRAHHMLIYGCEQPFRAPGREWKCGSQCAAGSSPKILYAWAKNAPPTTLPPDVGFQVGAGSNIKFLVLQIHYTNPIPDDAPGDMSGTKLTLTSKKQKYIAGIFLLLKFGLQIPPQTKNVYGDISCKYDGNTVLHPFAFRVHAHTLSTVISGYQYNGSYHQLGKGNPQWPQAFYPMTQDFSIRPGDYMAARCTFDSTGRNRQTRIGGTHNDEMCNFYMMYYTNATKGLPFYECGGENYSWLTEGLPKDSAIPLPPNPVLDMVAHAHSHGSRQGNPYNSRFSAGSYGRLAPEQRDSDYGLGGGWQDENPYDYYDTDPSEKPDSQDYFYYEVQNQRNRNRHPYKGNYQQPTQTQQHGGAFFPGFVDQPADRDPYRSSVYGDVSYQGRGRPSIAREHVMQKPGISKPTSNKFNGGGIGHGGGVGLGRDGVGNIGNSRGGRPGMAGGSVLPGQNGRPGSGNRGNPTLRTKPPSVTKAAGGTPPKQGTKIAAPKTEMPSNGGSVKVVPDWPITTATDYPVLGQVGGVATDSTGNVHVFHRGSRVWGPGSFNKQNQYIKVGEGAITTETMAIFNPEGKVIKQWGANLFYLPHGVHIDHDDNVWVTDVAMHQVIRFKAGSDKPDLMLGKRFEPGMDTKHFCKPTDVATLASGEFFVADGYCSHRIMKFAADGSFVSQWGTQSLNVGSDGFPPPGALDIPHSLVVLEDRSWVCVADRENGRIQCFNYDGTFVKQLHPTEFHGRLFSIAYCKESGLLYAVNGPGLYGQHYPVSGFVLDPQMGVLLEKFSPPGDFQQPHSITVSPDCKAAYVGQIEPKDPHKVWKFELQPMVIDTHPVIPAGSHQSVKKGGVVVKPETSDNGNVVEDEVIQKKAEDESANDLTVSMIIGGLLVVPIVVIVLVTVFMRMRRKGTCAMLGKKNRNRRFNLGNFFNRHKGFDRLNTEESDHELDHLNSDSDVEEYSATTRKA